MRTLLLLVTLLLPGTFQNPRETLATVLAQYGIERGQLSSSDLSRKIHDYAISNGPGAFVIAYYSENGDVSLGPLDIRVFERSSRVWRRSTQSAIGSALAVWQTGNRIYVQGHLTPSAEDTRVLSRDLREVTTLHGWILLLRPDDIVFYYHSMVHFAPTHPGELWLYDGNSGRDERLYPNKPYGPVRLEYIETVRKIYAGYPEQWFRENNHHEDPTLFDTHFDAESIRSGETDAVSFIAGFGGEAQIPTPPKTVLVACRNLKSAGPACNERDLATVRAENPSLSDTQLLERALR